MSSFTYLTEKDRRHLYNYLKDIQKYKSLSAEEEKSLIQKIRQGDGKAYDKLIKSNLKFVVLLASHYARYGIPLNDLIDEGNLGLIKAIRKFDETRGARFLSYAVWWIKQSILAALSNESNIIRYPTNKVQNIIHVTKASVELEKHLQRTPDSDELAEKLNLNIDEVIEALEHYNELVSLNSLILKKNSKKQFADVIADHEEATPDSALDTQSIHEDLEHLLEKVSWRERFILEMNFGICRENSLTLEDIAIKLNLTRERVRQIRNRAIAKLHERIVYANLTFGNINK